MTRGPDAGTLLTRALVASAWRSSVALTVASAESTRWASATFAGMRHRLTLTMSRSLDADSWIGELDDTDLPIRGHLVADVTLVALRRDPDTVTAEVEALTLEDR